jgi:hypothetical protein
MTVTLKLTKALVGHRGPVTQLTFREPEYGDYMVLGEPQMLVRTENGSQFIQETMSVFDDYAQRLLVDEDIGLLSRLSLRDAIAVKETISGFFHSARTEEKTASPAFSEASPAS